MLSELWEAIVCFVYIGGTVDHHCLNFLFINFYVDTWNLSNQVIYMYSPQNKNLNLLVQIKFLNLF